MSTLLTISSRAAKFETMATLYRSGQTLREIGNQFNCTREYIRQCLRKIRVDPSEGGRQKIGQVREEKLRASNNAQSLKRWGCNHDQYVIIRNLKKPTRAFQQQRKTAGQRGIGWELNLWQWWSIWQQSGKWSERGCGQGYVMCRNGDVGPYSIDNVFIATGRQNSSDQISKKSNLPMGVSRVSNNSFVARRKFNGKTKYLGCHRTSELAHAAYLSAGDSC